MKKNTLQEDGKLLDVQANILNFIRSFIEKNAFPPTVREICAGVGITSTSTTHENLKKLNEMGYLKYTPSTRRSIVLCDNTDSKNEKTVMLPVVGDVAAGAPILAEDNIQDYFALPVRLVKNENNKPFLLKIRGNSMVDIGMLDGDLIIVNPAVTAENGEIAVVRVDGDTATVKRFYLENDIVRLVPENKTMEPIVVKAVNVEIIGKVAGLIRQY